MPNILQTSVQNSQVFLGYGVRSQLRSILDQGNWSKVGILVDTHTRDSCLSLLDDLNDFQPLILEIPAGEASKNLEEMEGLWKALLEDYFDRKSVIITLGGGVVGDIGGFLAGTFMRGIDFIQMPTSLLAMVDASLGGKTGIDLLSYKNIIGMFNQPEAILIDMDFLKTLPDRQWYSGFAELLKHALIASPSLWKALQSIQSPADLSAELLLEGVQIKCTIVDEDVLEKGNRKALNFGHTVGHAIETSFLRNGQGNALLHGEAVGIGMKVEAMISNRLGLLSDAELKEILSCLKIYQLPADLSPGEIDMLREFMLHDKKNEKGTIRWTLLEGIGKFKVNQEVDFALVKECLQETLSGK